MHTCPCRGWPSISHRTQRCPPQPAQTPRGLGTPFALGFPESSRIAGLVRWQCQHCMRHIGPKSNARNAKPWAEIFRARCGTEAAVICTVISRWKI